MTPEQWRRIKDLFEAALAHEPATRHTFIREACRGDSALQLELESLLASHDRQGQSLSDILRLGGYEAGSHLGPYTILSLLGSGGMGDVYKARDTRLDRIVAIKVINPLVEGHDELLVRFQREARAVASLNHPHICTLYDTGKHEGVNFIVMEYLEGETLAERLSHGALPPDEVLRYAIQIADALGAAHGRGITHRDLKPANIVLTDRGAKLLDFGLAKLTVSGIEPSKSTHLTGLGRAPGTLHYMAPEQLAGGETDERTDIYAFGAVLYEMATGRRAFDGVRPIDDAALDAIITRCLERDPDERWPSYAPMLAALRNVAGETTTVRLPRLSGSTRLGVAAVILAVAASYAYRQWPSAGVPDSIAVLPFVNATDNPELDYLSEGMTDGLTNSLSRIPSLRVTPRTLVSSYEGGRGDVRSIARALNVQAVISGRISGRSNGVTVAVELIDVARLAQLWGAQYRSLPSEILNVEKAIAVDVAGRLQRDATAVQLKELTRQYADNAEGYQAYLQGRHHMRRRTREGYARAIEYFEQALAKDPNYALAYAGLADAMTSAAYFHVLPVAEAFSRARMAGQRAVELDELLAEAHSALGSVQLLYDWNFPEAARRLARAIELDPRSSVAHHAYSIYLMAHGRLDEAIAEAMRAEQLEPVAPTRVTHTGFILYFARRYDGAVKQAVRALELDPEFAGAYELLALITLARGAGVEELRQLLGRYEQTASAQGPLVLVGGVRGSPRVRAAFLAAMRKRQGPEPQPAVMAMICAEMAERAEALDWLDKAYAMRDGQLVWLNVHPGFDSLRSEPRFVDLVRRIGL